ncbi:PAS domain S-box protein [Hymenobacter sp. BT683]|uniref:histidine kinase n=1 Tax=Hymenobacter jeongseonensis TaxID=2791027 RepID=A0ABS0IH66_9BACT|nr:PAS domain S-box protein [Hymenobacter jeongseonensis]MBF9237700.1 PAS domain S-box protein [Hymenobacter jeongseonensis]
MPNSSKSLLTRQAQERLRNRAAQLEKDLTPELVAGVPPNVQHLVQELQVHQLELQMQYEELQSAHAAVQAARAQYVELYDFAPAALFTLEAKGGVIRQLNDRASRMLGTTAKRLTGRRFLLFVSPESRDNFLAFLDTVLATRQRKTIELKLQTEAGIGFVAHLEGVAGTTTAGAPAARLAVVDVTPLSQEMERRQHSEDRLHLALAASSTGVWVWTFASNELEWDARAQACFGRPHDPSPTSFAVLQAAVYAADVVPMQRALHASMQYGRPLDLELRAQWPDGSVHYLMANGKVQYNAQGRPECMIGLVRDVSDRRRAEEDLNYRNRQLQHLVDNMPVMFGRLSATGEYLELVGAGLRRLGIADNALAGSSVFEVFPTLTEPVRRVLAGESSTFMNVADVEGQRVYLQNYGFFDEQQQQGVVFSIDVTESERMKKQLFEEQKFTKSLLDHYVDGVAAFDHRGHLTAWNRAFEALTGLPEDEALGRDVFACLPFDRSSLPGRVVEHVLDGAQRPRYHQPFSLDLPPRDFELTAIPLASADGLAHTGGLLLLRDVTERNRLHASAAHYKAQQQRDTFRMVLMAQEVERKRIAEALHNGVGQLLYATKLHLENSATPGNAESLTLLEEAIKATRSVSFELTPSVLEDFGLAVALQKLAKSIPAEKLRLHLYLKGLQHPLPKVLTVAVYRMVQELLNNVMKHARANEATLHVALEDDQIHISMEDDGGGFDVASAMSAAKGIGLTSLYNRAALLGGQFELQSRRGRGTIATITLPVIEEEPEAQHGPAARPL